MIKLLDSSVISSVSREITSFDVLGCLKKQYEVCVTKDVKKECLAANDERIRSAVADVKMIEHSDPRIEQMKKAITKKHAGIGQGETDCIASSILLTLKGVENYLILDDKFARSIASNVHNVSEIKEILGSPIRIMNVTGTIGLISHLRDRGLIHKKEIYKIRADLASSSFRITQELIDSLK